MFQIGPHTINKPTILAPMAGITDLPFRKICKKLGAGLVVSEMTAANPDTWNSKKTKNRIKFQSEEYPRSVQIAGFCPKMMADAAIHNVQLGAQVIDINMGCPAKKVCKRAAGSALLKEPEIIKKIVVVLLGGNALYWPQNMEFNLKQDIGGAQVLLDSGVSLVMVPCKGVTSHLISTVPEIEKYIEPHGEIGKFLAMRFKEYNSIHKGWSKEIWDMAAVGYVLNEDWAPTYTIPSPILLDDMKWASDKNRHPIKIVYEIKRDPILKDFIQKLENFNNK